MAAHKILLVDDEKSLRFLVGNSLKHAGYEVETACSGAEGLQMALKNPPELILSDIMMPEMDGYEFIKRLRMQGGDSYVIFLTAKSANADLIRGFEVEADDYIVKPFQMPELLARIKAGLRLRKAQSDLEDSNEKLRAALSQRDDLINLIAHDLRNPLHVINSYAQIIGSDTLPPQTIRDVCIRRSEDMLRLINNVTDMNHMENKRLRFLVSKINLAMVAVEKFYLFEPIIEQKSIKVKKTIPAMLPVFCDSRRISEVLDSFFLAAFQLAEDDSELSVSLEHKNGCAVFNLDVVTIVSGAFIERIMRLSDGGKSWNDGLDTSVHLGLIVARRVVHLVGGEFYINKSDNENEVNLGFSIPCPDEDSIEKARERIIEAGGILAENS